MNFLKSLALVAALVVGSQSFAGTVYLSQVGQSVALPTCGGYVQLSSTLFGYPALKIVNNSQCSNIQINGVVYKSQDYEKIRINLGQTVARIHSNSGKTWDDVVINYSPTYSARFSNGQPVIGLSNCGGSASINVSGGQVNLVFRNVAQCSNFDILSSNGQGVNYPNQKIAGPNGNRSGSFTLPPSLYQYGINGVQVIVKSNSGKTADVLYVQFLAL